MTEPIQLETAFEILRNERRRHLLCLLARQDAPVSLRTATLYIIDETSDGQGDEIEDSLYRSVYVSLYQNHAPKLVEAGVVRFDDERQLQLEKGPETRELLRLLGCEFQDSWSTLYVGSVLSAVTVGVLGALIATGLATGAVVSLLVLSVWLAAVGATQYLSSITGWDRQWRVDASTSVPLT